MSRSGGFARHLPAAALVLLSVPLVFWGLGSYSLVNDDEEIYHVVARTMLESGNWLHLQFYDEHRVYDTFMNAPLQYWARALVIAAIGDNMWSARILSALLAVGGVLVTERLALRVTGSRTAGFLAGLVQLTTLQFVYLHCARTGELEPAVALLYTAIALLFLRAVEERRSFVGHHVCLALLLDVKSPTLLIPLLAEGACFALLPSLRAHFGRWLRTAVWVLPFGLVWHAGQMLALWQPFLQVTAEMAQQAAGHRPEAAAAGLAQRLGNAAFYAKTVLFGALPYAVLWPIAVAHLLVASRYGRDATRWRVLALFAAAVFVFYVAVSKYHRWYVIPAYPLLCVFLGAWLQRLPGCRPRALLLAAIATALGLLAALRVNLDLDPFGMKAWVVPMPVTGRVLGFAGPWLLGGGVAVAAGLSLWLLLRSRAQVGTAPAAALGTLLIGYALVRVVLPLRFLGHQSPMARLRQDLDARERSGVAIEEPIRPAARLGWDYRYYLADAYEIRSNRKHEFVLYRRR